MKTRYVFALCAFCGVVAGAQAQVSLKGTPDSLRRENAAAEWASLVYIEDDVMLATLKRAGELVPIPETAGVKIDARLDEKWAWVRPWVAEFLHDLGRDFHKVHQSAFRVSSAVRTVEYQGFLTLINLNAAPVTGDRRSTHPTGATIDITKRFLTPREIKWLGARLRSLKGQGLIEATEEFSQTVFHIMVLPRQQDDSRWRLVSANE